MMQTLHLNASPGAHPSGTPKLLCHHSLRRQSFLATFILKRRQDMIAQVLEFLSRGTDVL